MLDKIMIYENEKTYFFTHLSLYFDNIGCGSEKNQVNLFFLHSPFTIFVVVNLNRDMS